MIVDVDGNHGAGYWLRMSVQEVNLLLPICLLLNVLQPMSTTHSCIMTGTGNCCLEKGRLAEGMMYWEQVADRGAVKYVEVRGPGGGWMQLNNKYGASWEVS